MCDLYTAWHAQYATYCELVHAVQTLHVVHCTACRALYEDMGMGIVYISIVQYKWFYTLHDLNDISMAFTAHVNLTQRTTW